MANKGSGFSTLELCLSVSALCVIAAIAVPRASNSIYNYRLHSDASQMAGFLNVERMRATTQGAPYALDVNANNYAIEQLASITYDPLATPSTITYTSRSPVRYDCGLFAEDGVQCFQYLASGDSITNCRPTGVSAYPAPVTGDPSSCGTPFQIYFNTRGLPVDVHGNALSGTGGTAIYLMSTDPLSRRVALIDAVTVSAGGAVQIWNWNPSTSAWVRR